MTEKEILDKYRTVAIVGVSSDPEKPSNKVARYLSEHGYNVIPVTPASTEILGMTCYPDLASIPVHVEIVDIFRKPEAVKAIVEEAIKIGAAVIWMQEGIVNAEAAAIANSAGLPVIMNKCMMKEHKRLNSE